MNTPENQRRGVSFVHVYTPDGYLQVGGSVYESEVNKLVTKFQANLGGNHTQTRLDDSVTLANEPTVVYAHWSHDAIDINKRKGLLYIHGVVGGDKRDACEALLTAYGDDIAVFLKKVYSRHSTREVVADAETMNEKVLNLLASRQERGAPVAPKQSNEDANPNQNLDTQRGLDIQTGTSVKDLASVPVKSMRAMFWLISVGVVSGGIGLFLLGLTAFIKALH